MTIKFKNFQADLEIHKENFVYFVNHIIKFHENVQGLIWEGELKISKNQQKLKPLKRALPTNYQKNIKNFVLEKEKGYKRYDTIVKKFIIAYFKCLNIRYELIIFRYNLLGRRCRTTIKFPQELYDKFIGSFLVRIKRV